MKKLILLLAIMLVQVNTGITFARELSLTIINNSNSIIRLGTYKGIKVPSITEDGFGWEEINIKFRPYNRKASDIHNQTFSIKESYLENNDLVLIYDDGTEVTRQISITLCHFLDEDSIHYYEAVETEAFLTQASWKSVCMDSDHITLYMAD